MRGLVAGKAALHGKQHQIPDPLPADAGGAGRPTHHLAIASVEHKGDAYDLPVPAVELEAVGAPTRIGSQRLDNAVVHAIDALTGARLQEQIRAAHDPIDAFMVGAAAVQR
jgi:hypothetical protein